MDNKLVKFNDWVEINKYYLDNILNKVLNELYNNEKKFKYNINTENLTKELTKYLYNTSNTKYKKVQFM